MTSSSLTPGEQVKSWAAGDPKCPSSTGECCPDFSCCDRKLLASQETRDKFAKAFEDEDRLLMDQMCMGFLGGLVDTLDVDAHIVGSGDA